MTDEKLKMLMMLCMELMLEADSHQRGAVEIELDPAKVFGIAPGKPGAGKILIAIMGGKNRERLRAALAAIAIPDESGRLH